ncbi:MAG: glycosyltransferase [Planctomycetaceae bacterium]|nr:glycosyltransferase [Planctomycetaceae bacterium]
MADSTSIPIGFAITELDPGGAERAFTQIVTRLDRSRWSPIVYCLSGRGVLAETLEGAGIPVHYLEAGGKWDLGLVNRFANRLKQDQPRILQTFLHHANLAGRFAARKARVPIVVSGIRVAEERSRWRLRLDRWTQRWVTMNVCVSESVQQFSEEIGGLSPEKLCTIPNGVDFDRFANATPVDWTTIGLPYDAHVILIVGRLDAQKRPLLALRACLPLLETRNNLHLVFAGIGPDRKDILKIAEEEGLSHSIHCLGTRDDIPELMRGSELLLHVSAWEGAPNVILEAIASGLPIISTDTPGNRDALSGLKWGYFLLPESINEVTTAGEIGSAIEAVLDDRKTVVEKAMIDRDRFRMTRSWEATVSAYEQLYLQLLEQS